MGCCCYHNQLVNIRRELHKNPEEGWSEFTTTAFLVNTLRGYGYEVLLGRKVVNPDACLGRSMKVVEAGIERARKNGVSDSGKRFARSPAQQIGLCLPQSRLHARLRSRCSYVDGPCRRTLDHGQQG